MSNATPPLVVPATEQVTQLAAQYAAAAKAAKDAAAVKDSLAKRLKEAAEAARVDAGMDPSTKVVMEATDYRVTVTATEAWRLDTTRLKAEQPQFYAAYAVQSTSYRLNVVGE